MVLYCSTRHGKHQYSVTIIWSKHTKNCLANTVLAHPWHKTSQQLVFSQLHELNRVHSVQLLQFKNMQLMILEHTTLYNMLVYSYVVGVQPHSRIISTFTLIVVGRA